MKVTKELLLKALNTPSYPAGPLYQLSVDYFKEPEVASSFINHIVSELRKNPNLPTTFAQEYFVKKYKEFVMGTWLIRDEISATRYLLTVFYISQLSEVILSVLRSWKLLKEPEEDIKENVGDNRSPSHMEKMRAAKAAKKLKLQKEEAERRQRELINQQYIAKPKEAIQPQKNEIADNLKKVELERIEKLRNLFNT